MRDFIVKFKDIFTSWPVTIMNLLMMVVSVISVDTLGHPKLSVTAAVFFLLIYLAQLYALMRDVFEG